MTHAAMCGTRMPILQICGWVDETNGGLGNAMSSILESRTMFAH